MKPVNKLILGTVQLGMTYGINNQDGQVSLEESFRILNEAYHQGITKLDTAEVYGDAHEVIGAFHKKHPGKTFRVITKIPAGIEMNQLKIKISRYLETLCVDKLEAIMFHSFASYINDIYLLDHLTDLKSDGILSLVGVSAYTNREVNILIQDERIDLIQLPFNMLDNHSLRGELLEKAKEAGKQTHTRSAFLQGLFFKSPDDPHPVVVSLKNILNEFSLCLRKYEINKAALALQYCLNKPYIDNVLIGVDSVKQLRQNINACSTNSKYEPGVDIDQIVVENNDLLNPSKW
jgi:uncharacterized protein